MAVSYNKLWKLLIDKRIKRRQLCSMARVSTNVIAKMEKYEDDRLDALPPNGKLVVVVTDIIAALKLASYGIEAVSIGTAAPGKYLVPLIDPVLYEGKLISKIYFHIPEKKVLYLTNELDEGDVDRGCAVELSISWYNGMWNRVIEDVGINFLKDYHGLHEVDVAEYAAGKNILVSDFLEFVETEVDLENLFRYPEKDIGKAV